MSDFLSRVVPRGAFFHSLYHSTYTIPVGKDLLSSPTFNFINPRHHLVNTDKVSQHIPASAAAGLSDEEILSLFTGGFFGGFVFRIESWLLRMAGARFLPARYTSFQPEPQAVTIRRPSAIPSRQLLPVGSLFFNSFLLVDKHIAALDATPSKPVETVDVNSYVDYGFGSDTSRFAGCHRFRVTRLPPTPETSDAQIRIDLEHFRCNPRENVPSLAEPIQWFHFLYAKALFANGIQALLKR
ncbi:hypothetical protein SPBR_03214 [Sporothrix brasiliensis 5110]|uniref:Uncharacterized protein n=1 Tax=Sporothrix brasiliensis 5110 TaxID=1398154 RepID=A0A0C2FMZ1_9PEZI|nr:uncharacterized protein SPBR_03214 [Sporothrix brasiliensis 5110]KIH92418.1 hypothetical protein SPBR_03214 [Sporothrix brasiliensis 5110]